MRRFYYAILSLLSGIVKRFFKNNLRVIAYHEIPNKELFQTHLNYLDSHYSIIDLDTLKNHIYTHKKLPPYPLLITFDDGYMNIFKNAVPVLIDKKLPACIFIITSYVNSNKEFWWINSLKHYKKSGLSLNEAKKKNLLLKKVTNEDRINLLRKIEPQEKEQISSSYFKELESHNINIGNHTHTHPILDKCTREEILTEITYAQKSFDLWNISGKNIFAYPNGNWTKEIEEILKKNDIELAFLFDHKINKHSLNPYRISRLSTNASMSIQELKVKVSGLHSIISNNR